MSFKRNNLVAIVGQNDVSREAFLKKLQSYSKAKIMKGLKDLESLGPGMIQAMNVGDAVAQKMGHPDPEVQAAAITVLGLMGHKAQKYEQWITPCLGNPTTQVRAAAVEALGHLGAFIKDPSVLAGNLTDSAPLVRVKVCEALAEMEAFTMHASVAGLLKDESPEVQCAALETLGLFIAMSLEMESEYSGKIGEVLGTMLGSSRTKTSALDAITSMGDKAPTSCVSGTVAALADKDPVVRVAAVAAIAALGEVVVKDKGAVSNIKDLLKSDSAGTKAAAANALATLGEKASTAASDVAALLSDDSEDTSGAALVAGGGSRRLPPHMRRPKCAAITALGRMGDEANVSKISEAMNDQNWEVRLCAAEALAMLKEKAKSEVSTLLGSLEDDAFPVRAMVCFALGQIGDSEALPRLVECFEDTAFTVRLYAVQALGQMGELAEEHCHDVFKLTNDPVSDVKAAAVRVLSTLGETAQSYASVLSTMISEDDPNVRAAVCESLANMGEQGSRCQEEIEDLLNDPEPSVRSAAITALESMSGYVTPFLKDFGKGPGVPNDLVPYWRSSDEKPKGVLLPGEISFEGLGLHFGDIVSKKQDLVQSGKWVEGVL